MRSPYVLALILAASLRVRGQTATGSASTPSLPTDPRKFFELAVPHYDFSDPKLKPWHLKASYEIYDYEGKLTTKGTWEYWWASPKVRRRTWERLGMSRTDWITEDGTIYRKESGDAPLYFERRLEDIILHPGPNDEGIAARKLKLELKAGKGATSPTCLSTIPKQSSNGMAQVLMQANQVIYCYDPATMALLSVDSPVGRSKYGEFVVMQDHYIARRIAARIGEQSTIHISVDSIDGIDPVDKKLTRDADSIRLTAPGRVSGGKVLKQTDAFEVLIGKPRMRGIIFACATIGKDGRVQTVEVLSAPSKIVADAVTDAVKKWIYEPLTVNGEPIESEYSIQTTL